MKTVTKLVMGAAALVATVGAAHAAQTTNPSTGASNLVFFVNDATAHSTYSIVLTGEGVGTAADSLFTSGQAASSTTQGSLNTLFGDANFSVTLSGNTALQTFISNGTSAGDTLDWGILGGAYTGGTASARETAGAVQVVATAATAATIVAVGESGIDGAIPTDVNHDVGAIAAKTPDAFGGTASGVFGMTASSGGTNLTLYGNGVDMSHTVIGSSYGLYGLSTNGGSGGTDIAYSLGQVSFDGSTLSFTGNVLPTPLPAAAWLFGSGLLGLLGIGRRRDIKVA